ncbi:hypothetical protein HMPREF3038_02301 [Akkermansia sp. KLE1797]|nr:hypothetical protein HMPREF3038_02301 [Akkermansia sp. KLE1797]KXU53637.1 hypothetical protein HMPREF3039_02169 [Akkermansia sp. KLE1798]KZA03877.1 hypothetical protein HMPREF1326_02417 [Akkermansia sp. KLE1605]
MFYPRGISRSRGMPLFAGFPRIKKRIPYPPAPSATPRHAPKK